MPGESREGRYCSVGRKRFVVLRPRVRANGGMACITWQFVGVH